MCKWPPSRIKTKLTLFSKRRRDHCHGFKQTNNYVSMHTCSQSLAYVFCLPFQICLHILCVFSENGCWCRLSVQHFVYYRSMPKNAVKSEATKQSARYVLLCFRAVRSRIPKWEVTGGEMFKMPIRVTTGIRDFQLNIINVVSVGLLPMER